MLSFVQSWFAPTANPIGIDFGSDSLRMAQVDLSTGEPRLVAAARADVPTHVRNDPLAKLSFFAETTRDLWSQGNFRGRRVILSLPASVMTIQHLRVAKMDDAALKQSLVWECSGKLPYDPSHALLRHLVAGEVFADGESKQEVIVMAAQREWVNQFLAAAAKARLDVVGMNVEPKATVDCFAQIYRRKTDADAVNLFVDIGCGATRAVIAKGSDVLFARSIPIGGDHLTRAVSAAMKVGFEEAKIRRIKECQETATEMPPAGREVDRSSAEPVARPSNVDGTAQASREVVDRLCQELSLCRRYHEATFPNHAVTRLIFVGGEARQRWICQHVAQSMDLAAQLGDPMVRLARTAEIGPESGIDRRLPQPDWAVAIGLSLGPVGAPVAAAK